MERLKCWKVFVGSNFRKAEIIWQANGWSPRRVCRLSPRLIPWTKMVTKQGARRSFSQDPVILATPGAFWAVTDYSQGDWMIRDATSCLFPLPFSDYQQACALDSLLDLSRLSAEHRLSTNRAKFFWTRSVKIYQVKNSQLSASAFDFTDWIPAWRNVRLRRPRAASQHCQIVYDVLSQSAKSSIKPLGARRLPVLPSGSSNF